MQERMPIAIKYANIHHCQHTEKHWHTANCSNLLPFRPLSGRVSVLFFRVFVVFGEHFCGCAPAFFSTGL